MTRQEIEKRIRLVQSQLAKETNPSTLAMLNRCLERLIMTDAEIAVERLTAWVRDCGDNKPRAFIDDISMLLLLAKEARQMRADHDRIKAEVIRMRDYAMRKSVPIGECVAWCRIKERYGAGQSDQVDFDWLKEYDARSSA